MPMKDGIHNLALSLLQRGNPMRKRGYGAPPSATKDISTSSSPDGRAVRKDSGWQPFISRPSAHGTGAVHTGTPRSLTSDICSRTVCKQQKAF
jgi:hypothetical protein